MRAKIEYIETPYHKDFCWQVDFGGLAKQWYKSEEEAQYAKAKWDEIEDYKDKEGEDYEIQV